MEYTQLVITCALLGTDLTGKLVVECGHGFLRTIEWPSVDGSGKCKGHIEGQFCLNLVDLDLIFPLMSELLKFHTRMASFIPASPATANYCLNGTASKSTTLV